MPATPSFCSLLRKSLLPEGKEFTELETPSGVVTTYLSPVGGPFHNFFPFLPATLLDRHPHLTDEETEARDHTEQGFSPRCEDPKAHAFSLL